MSFLYRQRSGCRFQIQNWRENNNRRRHREMMRRGKIGFGSDPGRIDTCCALAAVVNSARAVIVLMRGAGAVALVDGARGRNANWPRTGAQTDAVNQQR